MDRKQRSQMTTGLVLIALGLIFLAQRLTLLPHFDFHRLWPVFLVVLGLAKFLTPSEEGRWGGGAWLMFLGLLFLLHTYQIFRLSDSWPLFIVASGLSILFGRSSVQGGAVAQPRQDLAASVPIDAPPVAPVPEGDSHGR